MILFFLQVDQLFNTNIDIKVNSTFMIIFRRFRYNSWPQVRDFIL